MNGRSSQGAFQYQSFARSQSRLSAAGESNKVIGHEGLSLSPLLQRRVAVPRLIVIDGVPSGNVLFKKCAQFEILSRVVIGTSLKNVCISNIGLSLKEKNRSNIDLISRSMIAGDRTPNVRTDPNLPEDWSKQEVDSGPVDPTGELIATGLLICWSEKEMDNWLRSSRMIGCVLREV
ncbi:hypothetical protein CEXT_393331 [Caerostris extrusa]|uniref:Uncharacterized protein n=1 Tax=Caerostris extrusa TaxID=172846 RepID=A0AAV4NSH2_CAEEX|nr:hypothetical protein CEXT_393331 [Caerostris extrusa]